MPKTTPGNTTFSLYIPNEVLEELKRMAEAEDRSVANMIQHLIKEHLRERSHG